MFKELNPKKKKTENGLAIQCSKLIEEVSKYKVNERFLLAKMTQKLDLERRRIYDILNVLTVVGYFSKISPGIYQYNGEKNISQSLSKLKTEASQNETLKERINSVFTCKENLNPEEETTETPVQKPLEKIGLVEIAKIFIQVFLLSKRTEIKQIEFFSIFFPGRDFDSTNNMMRRILDIVRVVSQIQLIEKSNSTGKTSSYVWKSKEDLTTIKEIETIKYDLFPPNKKRKVEEIKFKKILPKEPQTPQPSN
eukprot:gene3010-5020_t